MSAPDQAQSSLSALPPRYAPGDHEPRIIEKWDAERAFHADPGPVIRGEKKPYAVVIPPPNVTDRLHLGHALNNSLQDILVRVHRMMGYEAVWFPGTDHAGIATQTKVDRTLVAEGKNGLAFYKKKELAGDGGRDEFIALVQSWKDKYEAEIIGQLKRMGCSCDWERNRFTMDDICARAVREAFFRFFKDGLIYRGKRLVNWDPATQTALSDDEVENKEVDGNFYYMRYPVVRRDSSGSPSAPQPLPLGERMSPSSATGEGYPVSWADLKKRGYPTNLLPGNINDTDQAFVTVATTRPETYLGDTGVGVNPRDPRAKSLEGLSVQLPIVGRIIPIIADDYVVMPAAISGSSDDPKAAFATGFLKVTPAHDENDWSLGIRHNLAVINVMGPDASISKDHGWTDIGEGGAHVFIGLSREDARREVVKAFKAKGLMEKVMPYRHSVGHSYRSHVPIEPYLSDQWYVKVTDDRMVGFAQRALAAPVSAPPSGPASDRPPSDGRTGFQPVSSSGITIHERHLPHWQQGGRTYFITFRVKDGVLSEEERQIVLDACFHWDGTRADIHLVTVMPDHVHMLLTPREQSPGEWWSLQSLMQSIKGTSARTVNQARGVEGTLWQAEYFDRIVRDKDEFFEKCRYMLDNPVKAGLVKGWQEYPFTRGDGLKARPTAGQKRAEDSGDGALRIFPERYAKTYETWHANLRDWCISRQLWWGHRIPVWQVAINNAMTKGANETAVDAEKRHVAEVAKALRGYLDSCGVDQDVFFNEKPEFLDGLWVWCVGARTSAAAQALDLLAPYVGQHGSAQLASATAIRTLLGKDQLVAAAGCLAKIHSVIQDPDVLDTWFSSALWPLSTMGWPDPALAAKESGIADFPDLLKAFNPTDVLCTAREIITLWVSRMVMYNRYFLSPDGGATPGPVPFKDVFIHAMIQDGEGRKMSKSLGNGVDPLDIISSHGTDAMRFVLCQMTTQTQDVRMPVSRDPATGKNTSPKFDIGRNFCTKLWNAARYALSNLESCPPSTGKVITRADLGLADRWMLSRLESTVRAIEESLRDYQFSAYATAMYDLLWRDYCDWYLEAVKPTLKSSPAQQAIVQCVLDAILRLLHPICPFITEVLFEPVSALPPRSIDGLILGRGATTVCRTAWPIADGKLGDQAAERDFARAQALVEAIRQARSGAGVKNSERLTLHGTPGVLEVIRGAGGVVEAVAGLSGANSTPASPGAIEVRFEGESLHLSGVVVVVDQGAERAGFEAAAAKLAKDIELIEKRLNNPGYMQKAPAHLVEETRGQLAAKVAEREDLLRRLESVR